MSTPSVPSRTPTIEVERLVGLPVGHQEPHGVVGHHDQDTKSARGVIHLGARGAL